MLAAEKPDRRLHLQPAGRARLFAGGVAHCVDDVPAVARLLPVAPPKGAVSEAGERREHGFAGGYYRNGRLGDRSPVARAGLALTLFDGGRLSWWRACASSSFRRICPYLSYVDVWLPEDATIGATNATAAQAEAVIRRVADAYATAHPGDDGKPRDVLTSVTSFVGGGGPRFWFSVAPELFQPNYAQLIINLRDKHDTATWSIRGSAR